MHVIMDSELKWILRVKQKAYPVKVADNEGIGKPNFFPPCFVRALKSGSGV